MNKTQLSQHHFWLAVSAATIAVALNLAVAHGTAKPCRRYRINGYSRRGQYYVIHVELDSGCIGEPP